MEKPLILGNNKCLKGISSIHQFLPLMGYQNLARTFLCGEMILQQMLGIQGTTEPGSAGLGAAGRFWGCPQCPSQHTAGAVGSQSRGIDCRGDTSFLIMHPSFLSPGHIWAVFLGSQFSSLLPHMASPSPLTEIPSSAEKQPPAAHKAPRGVANTRRQQSRGGEKRDKTLNKAMRQLWKKSKQE